MKNVYDKLFDCIKANPFLSCINEKIYTILNEKKNILYKMGK